MMLDSKIFENSKLRRLNLENQKSEKKRKVKSDMVAKYKY